VKNNDTINSVLLRIAMSGTGVIGFVNDDRITLATLGSSEAPIVLGHDTSGFLAATKLAGAVSTIGNVRDDSAPLSRSSQFSTVIDGSFSVNGVAISVNRHTDSLTSILGRVNNSAAGVTATYDAEADVVRFAPKVAGAPVSLDQDTSGFLRAIRMPTGAGTTVVDPDRKFNGQGLNAPGFDPGHTVRGGSFTVNGTTITVAADDTLNTVLNRITASSAGVTAKFDRQSGKVSLAAKSYNEQITVGNDTSGFLAAVKLDATAQDRATTVSRSAFSTRIGDLSEFDSVTRGTVTVNGEQIAIDPNATTVDDFVDQVENVKGVRAALNRATGVIDIWSDDRSKLMFGDTSGLLDSIGIRARVFDNFREGPDRVVQTGTVTVSNARDVAGQVAWAVSGLNDVLAGLAAERDGSFRAGLKAALATPLDLLRDAGVRGLELVDDGERVTLSVSAERLAEALEATREDVDLARELAAFVDAVDRAVAAAAGWDADEEPATQVIRLEDTSHARVSADQAQAMAGKPAVKAYKR
jgi:hypothetical protein